MELAPVLPLIYATVLGSLGIIFYKVRSANKLKVTRITQTKKKSESSLEGQLEKMIDDAPNTIKQLDMLIAEQKKAGVTEDQLKGLYSKRQMLEYAANYGELAKPLVKPLAGMIGKLGNIF